MYQMRRISTIFATLNEKNVYNKVKVYRTTLYQFDMRIICGRLVYDIFYNSVSFREFEEKRICWNNY